jgi:lipoprotein-anchoring transpeptidase ErfK/SrfK
MSGAPEVSLPVFSGLQSGTLHAFSEGMKNSRLTQTLSIAFCSIAATAKFSLGAEASDTESLRRIVVSLSQKQLALWEGDSVIKVYEVSVGKSSTPSPVGSFEIVNRIDHPTWYGHGRPVPPGARNPLGTRWIGLSKAGYGIHGTNEPDSIGKAASHGCIRMRNHDVEELFVLVKPGMKVEFIDF